MCAAGGFVEVAGEVVSRVFGAAGLVLLLVAVAHLLRMLGAAAVRAVRAWRLAARHMRRASAARDAGRRSRERFLREHAASEGHGYLRLLRGRDPASTRADEGD
jgi:hypothetical protein